MRRRDVLEGLSVGGWTPLEGAFDDDDTPMLVEVRSEHGLLGELFCPAVDHLAVEPAPAHDRQSAATHSILEGRQLAGLLTSEVISIWFCLEVDLEQTAGVHDGRQVARGGQVVSSRVSRLQIRTPVVGACDGDQLVCPQRRKDSTAHR